MKKMKEIADKTLSKVRREIREARKMKDTVSRLQKLRAIRNDTAEKRGQTFPPSVAEHFTAKTEDLIDLLSQQIQAFEKEEAALKLILETENEEAKERERAEKKEKERGVRQRELDEERQCLFGNLAMPGPGDPMQPFTQYYLQALGSLHALQSVRQGWDAFLVPEGTPLASRVPDGWVIPEPPSSSVWASVLQAKLS
ncbi:programmed cell death protein 7-like isoform X4 [Babylonia areolata]|uniref:programmed cell death protein 7-like isoform X4 n=1 Tax=Babylonia areolata TaxID=304850 RepID=UPI003FCFC4AA